MKAEALREKPEERSEAPAEKDPARGAEEPDTNPPGKWVFIVPAL